MTEASQRPQTMPPLALLAGGLATRLRPLTTKVPKAMLVVAGEPFIAHQLRLLASEGIERVVVCAGFLAEQIQEYVGDGNPFGLDVKYSLDGDALRGTGGALRRALPLLGDSFFVLYGDSYLDIAYRPVARAFEGTPGSGALMTVLANDDRWDTSNVVFAGGRILKYDKKAREPAMRHIDYGLGVLRSNVLAQWPAPDPFDLADVYTRLAAEGRLAGYEVATRFYEIGSPQGLAETEAYLKTRGQRAQLPAEKSK